MNTITVPNTLVADLLTRAAKFFYKNAILDGGVLKTNKSDVVGLFQLKFPNMDYERTIAAILAEDTFASMIVSSDDGMTILTIEEQRRREREQAEKKVDRAAERSRRSALLREAKLAHIEAALADDDETSPEQAEIDAEIAALSKNPNAPAFLTVAQVTN